MSQMRRRIFNAIRKERAHQDNKFGFAHNMNQSLAGYLVVLQNELDEARAGWTKGTRGRNSVRNELVQIAAVAVAALEAHGLESEMPKGEKARS